VGARFSATVQTGSGAHPASYTMGTGFLPGMGRDADRLPPSSTVGIERVELYTFALPMGRTACTEPQYLYKGDLYLYLYHPHPL
jgi:hypothetical protein